MSAPQSWRKGLGLLFLDRHIETNLPEVSFLFPRRNWGQGLALRSVTALTNWATDRYGPVCAETQSVNTAARKVLEGAGFRALRPLHRFGIAQIYYLASPATGEAGETGV